MAKYRFMCIKCNHVYLINHQKVRFFDGSLCEKCGGALIPKGKDIQVQQPRTTMEG
jgi:rRNA maturation endonuclease Nob1